MSSTSYDCPWLAPDGSLMALADCDTFYASCERVCRPDLEGKPVVVLSNNDGCLVAMSREAKKLGLPMGKPAFQVKDELERYKVAVFSSNYTLYGDLSHRVMQTFQSVVPKVEVYSIDEAFLPLTGALAANAVEIAQTIRQRALRWVGLPVSVGIAPTRVLAKIATRVAKKFPAYGGIFDLSRSKKIDAILNWVSVGDLWGVGRKGARKLLGEGIRTARELRDADPGKIRKLLTVHGLNILMELRGIPSISEDIPATHTCIISSRSLGYKVTSFEPMAEAVAFHAARAAEKLRAKKLATQMVSVRIQTAYYAEDQPQHDEQTMVRLERPTSDSGVILAAARRGVERIFRYGYGYAKAMVMLTDLSDRRKCQPHMLDMLNGNAAHDARRQKLMELMDRINRLEGRGTLRFAAQGSRGAAWHMKRENLSPAWTTCLGDLLVVGGKRGCYRAIGSVQDV